jgi:hypothetical protein
MTVGSTWCARAATRRTFLARRSTPCPTDNAGLAHGCARSRAVTGTSPAFGRIHVAKGPGAYPLVDQMPGGNPQVVASQPCRRGAVSGLQQMRRGGRRLVHGKRRRVGVRRSCGLRRFRCAADAITDVTPALADVNGGRRGHDEFGVDDRTWRRRAVVAGASLCPEHRRTVAHGDLPEEVVDNHRNAGCLRQLKEGDEA